MFNGCCNDKYENRGTVLSWEYLSLVECIDDIYYLQWDSPNMEFCLKGWYGKIELDRLVEFIDKFMKLKENSHWMKCDLYQKQNELSIDDIYYDEWDSCNEMFRLDGYYGREEFVRLIEFIDKYSKDKGNRGKPSGTVKHL